MSPALIPPFSLFLPPCAGPPESDRQQMISRGITSNLLQRFSLFLSPSPFLLWSCCLMSLYYLEEMGERGKEEREKGRRRTQLERPKTMPSIHLFSSFSSFLFSGQPRVGRVDSKPPLPEKEEEQDKRQTRIGRHYFFSFFLSPSLSHTVRPAFPLVIIPSSQWGIQSIYCVRG